MSNEPNCAAIEQHLSDLLAGGLDDASQRVLSEHLKECAACTARAAVLYKQDRALAELGAHDLIENLRQRIHEQLTRADKPVQSVAVRRLKTVRLRRTARPSRSMAGLIALAASVMIAVTLFFMYHKDDPSRPEILAHLASFSGKPTVLHDGRAIEARDNLSLMPGDTISVPLGAKATVQYVDQDTHLIITSASVLRLNPSDKGKRVYLESGSLDAEVAPQHVGTSFVLGTPVARAEVIGTQFRLSAELDKTRLDVNHGRVRLVRGLDNAQVEVAASQYAIALQTGQLLAQDANPQPPKREQIKRLITPAEQNDLKARAAESNSAVQEAIRRFSANSLRNTRGTIAYRLFTPEMGSADKKYPLVIFLHGIGGAGKDNMKQLSDQPFGAGIWAISENQARHPCFIVAPQTTGGWEGNPHVLALDLVDELLKTLPIDRQHVYVTGISSGGNGAFWMLQTRPKQFAAGVLISGWLPDARNAKAFSNIPIWLFHGNADPTVKVINSRQTFDALSTAGADVRFHEFDGAGHGIFAPAYCTPDLVEWVFSRSAAP